MLLLTETTCVLVALSLFLLASGAAVSVRMKQHGGRHTSTVCDVCIALSDVAVVSGGQAGSAVQQQVAAPAAAGCCGCCRVLG